MKTILILASNPYGDLRIDQEIRDLTAAIERSKDAEEFAVVSKLAVRSGDLHEIFDKNTPYVVHFCGHGAGEQGLVNVYCLMLVLQKFKLMPLGNMSPM